MKKKIFFLAMLLPLVVFLGQACQEFIDDSFETFQVRLVDQQGIPHAGLELLLSQNNPEFPLPNHQQKPIIYTLKTSDDGRLQFVLPAKNLDNDYYLEVSPPYVFEVDYAGESIQRSFFSIGLYEKDIDGVVDLGELLILKP